MSTGVRLGNIRGVEIVVDVSVFVVAGLLAWLLSTSLSAEYDVGAGSTVLALIAGIAYIGSLLLHELSHGLVAKIRDLPARRIRLLIFGGYTLIDSRDSTPANEFWVAIAGPAASLVAGGLLWALAWAMGWHEPTADTLRVLALINLLIGAINLLPGLPLDGGRAVRALLWHLSDNKLRATEMATLAGRVLGLGVAVIGVVLIVFVGDLTGFVWILLGWFLSRSATASGQREELIIRVAGATARDVMQPTPDAVPGPMRVADVTSLFQTGPTMRTLPVEVEGRVKGIIGQAEIDGLAPGRRELGRAAAVMTPIGPDDIVEADTRVDVLIARFGTTPRLVVVDGGVVVGVMETDDLLSALT